jgi:hypothetical protein
MDDVGAIFAGLLHDAIHTLAQNHGRYTTADRFRHLTRHAQCFQ